MQRDWFEPLGVLFLRAGLAAFLFVWGYTKILAPGQYERLLNFFYDKEYASALQGVADNISVILGVLQIVLALLILAGAFRVVVYAVGVVIHTSTIIVIHEKLFNVFEYKDNWYFPNRGLFTAVPVWTAFIALWLLRSPDRWSFDAWWQGRRRS